MKMFPFQMKALLCLIIYFPFRKQVSSLLLTIQSPHSALRHLFLRNSHELMGGAVTTVTTQGAVLTSMGREVELTAVKS